MTTRNTLSTTLAGAALLLAGFAATSCSEAAESKAQAPAASTAEAPALPPEVSEVTSQEQADQDAEKTIDEKNADDEMDKLEKEMEAGGGGG